MKQNRLSIKENAAITTTKPSRILQDGLANMGEVAQFVCPNLPSKHAQKQAISRVGVKDQLTEPRTLAEISIPDELKVRPYVPDFYRTVPIRNLTENVLL